MKTQRVEISIRWRVLSGFLSKSIPDCQLEILYLHFLDVFARLEILQGCRVGVSSGPADFEGIQLCLINNGCDLREQQKYIDHDQPKAMKA
jgi:hypothetical protein